MRKQLRDDMERLGVEQDAEHCFGRPRIKGVPVFVITERFSAWCSVLDLARDYNLTSSSIDNAIRFALLYPNSDHPAFWKVKP